MQTDPYRVLECAVADARRPGRWLRYGSSSPTKYRIEVLNLLIYPCGIRVQRVWRHHLIERIKCRRDAGDDGHPARRKYLLCRARREEVEHHLSGVLMSTRTYHCAIKRNGH